MKNIIVIDKNSGSVKSVENVRTLSSDRASVFLMKLPPESVESFKRDGDDLVIVLKNGQTIIISDFFMKYADGKPVDSVAEEAARNDEEDDRDQDHEDIERNELILEDDEGVAWWGQYPEQWSEFHFTEIEWGDGGGAMLPIILGALGVVGLGAVAAGGGGNSGDNQSVTPPPVTVEPEDELTAEDDTNTTSEDTPVSGSVAGNDSTTSGGTLTFAKDSDPANGTVTVNPDGTYTYTPDDNFNGEDSFTYTVTDEETGESLTRTVTITVGAENDLTAQDDTNTTSEDTPVSGSVAGNDSTTSGGTLTFAKESDPANGTVTVNPDGTYTYTPDDNFNGEDSFTYTVTDEETGESLTRTVTITVGAESDLTAQDDTNTTSEDTPVSGSVAGNDSTTSGGTLTFAKESDPANGTVTVNPDGTYTYTPDDNFNGEDSFTYTVTDEETGESLTRTVTITVGAESDLTAQDDTNTTSEDTPVSGSVAGNDSTTSGGTLTFAKDSDPANGTVVVNPDGTYTYTPAPNFSGLDSFTYTVTDEETGESSVQIVTITVEPVVDIAAANDTNTTSEDTPVSGSVASNDSTTSGGSLTFAKASDPANGTVTVNPDGTYTYTPDANFNGEDSFTYQVRDQLTGETLIRTVTITVAPVVDLTAADDSNTTDEDTPVSGSVAGNDSTTSGGTLTFAKASDPANGTVVVNPDGTYTYTPTADFHGEDTFTYTVTDADSGESLTQTVTITVNPVNDAPEAAGTIADQSNLDAESITDLDASSFFSDVDGDTLGYSAVGLPNGLMIDPVTGIISGTIDNSASQDGTGGVHSVTVTADDGNGGSVDQTFTWTVTNPGPTANDDTATTDEDTPVSGNVITASGPGDVADSDPDADALIITTFTVDGDATTYNAGDTATISGIGTITLAGDGDYTFTPDANWNGTVPTVTYTVSDSEGGTDTANLDITVNPVNDAPEAAGTIADQSNLDAESITDLDASSFFSDVDGDTLGYSAVGLPNGLMIDPVTGIISGTIDNSASQDGTGGVHSVTVTADDGNGGSVDQTFTWTVTNPGPTANDDTATTDEDTPVSGNVITASGPGDVADSDPDADALIITTFTVDGDATTYNAGDTATISGIGTITLAGDGDYTFTPDANWNGTVPTVTYTVSDSEGGTDTANLDITVNPVNDAPEAAGTIADQSNLDAESITDLDASSFFSDVDGDTLGYSAVGLPNGLMIDPVTGIISGTIDNSASQDGTGGVHSVTVTADDGNGGSVDQTFTWTVTNPGPTANDDTATTDEDTPVSGNVITASGPGDVADSDPDADALVITTFTVDGDATTYNAGDTATISGIGTITLAGDGDYTFTPDANWNGTVPTVTYTVSDSEGGTDTANLDITVNPVVDLTAADDSNTTDEDTPVSGSVAGNDNTTSGGTLTFAKASDPANGMVVVNPDGTYTYTPNADFHGEDTFTYTVTDADSGESLTQTVTITVNPVNDAPEAAGTIADQSNLDAEGITNLDASSFFSDVDGDTLGYSAVGLPNGLMIDPVTGIISGTIDNSASQDGTGGVHSVTVTADDGNGGSVDQTFTWTVTNPGPTANDDTATTDEDTPVSGNVITASGAGDVADSDPDADALVITTFTVDGDATTYNAGDTATISGIGTITLAGDGDYTFTPDANWNGTVPTVTYTVSDSEGGTDTANLDITVNPVVDLTAADDSNTTDEDTPVSGSVAGNDNTTSGGTLTFAKASDPANGMVVVNPDGTYTYTPNADFHGEDTFTYTVTDADSGESLTQTVTITVNPVNDAPEIVEADQSGNVAEAGNLDDGSVVAGQPTSSGSYSATDIENDTLTWSVLGTLNGATIDPADTTYGSFSINPSTGAWSYALNNALPATQALNEGDTVDLIYVIEADDGNGGTDTRNVTITINGTNDAPFALADTATAVESGVLDGGNTPTSGTGSASGNVLANDSDVDDGETATLTVNAFSFGASDGTLGASLEGTYGSLVLNANGSYTYTLDNSLASTQALQQGETASEVFSYTTQDVNGAVSTSTLTVSITGTNDRPTITSTATDAQGSVTEIGTNDTGVATANGQMTASDVDTAATQTWTVLSTNGTYGTIGIDAMTGEWTYTLDDTRPATQALNDGDSETETFTARVTDEHGAFRDQTITITVNGSNDEFMGSGNVTVNLNEDGSATGTLQDYVDDVDDSIEITGFTVDADGDGSDESYTPGTPITVQDSDGNTLGTLNISTGGDYSFVPVANYAGDVPTVTYTAAETGGGGVTVTQTIDFSITKIADAPGMEASKTVNTAEDTAVALGLVAPVVADTGTGTANNDNSERLGAISLTITGSGANGVTLANGAETLNFVGGEITIVLTDGNHVDSVPAEAPASGIYHMTTAEYEALLATPSAESGQDFTITVSATSYEVDAAGTIIPSVAGASNTQTVDIDVQAVTDGASLTIAGGPSTTLSGDEDTAIDIAGHLAAMLDDIDTNPGTDSDGSETYWYSVTGLPVGSEVNFGGTTTTVTSVAQVISSATSTSPVAPTFTITPPGDFSGDIDNVTITLNSQDTDGDSAGSIATHTSSVTLDLRVDPVAGDVRRSNSSTQEDQAVDFLSGVRVVDNGTGNEVIDSVGFSAPAGWTVTEPTAMAGWTNTGTGSDYLIEFDSGLTEAQREAILDAFLITPAPHSSADQTIALTITSTDTNTVGGVPVSDTATVTQSARVTVTPVAERTDSDSDGDGNNDVTMTAGHTYSTSGQEDAWFDLNVEPAFDLSNGWSNEDSDEELFAVLTPSLTSSTPGDTVIGTQFRYSTDGGSTFTIETYGGSPVWVPVAYLDTLEVKLPADTSGTLTIGVEAGTIDTDPDNGATAQAVSGSATLAFIEIDPVADAVTMALNGRAVGLEDTAIPLDIEVVSTDTSETFNVTISGIPNGASIMYNGSVLTVTAGSVTITDFDNSAPMSITPPADSNVDFSLNVSAVSVDGSDTSAPVSRTISVAVTGVADTPSVTLVTPDFVTAEAALDSSGNNQVALSDIVTGVVPSDADGSETATLRITGLDAAFSITGATSVVSGTGTERVWVTSTANLGDVSVILPENYSGTVDIQFAGVATENDGDSLTAAPIDASFTVTPSPEATITDTATLIEDQITPLNLAIVHQNGDADETLGEIYVPVSYDDSDYTLFVGGSAIDSAGLATTTIGTTTYYIVPTAQVGNLGALTALDLDGPLTTLDFQYQVIDPSSDGTLLEQASVNPGTISFAATPVTDAVDASITAITLTSATGTTSNATPSGDDADPDTASITGSGSLTVNMHVDSADVDGSEHLVRILISGVPEGVTVTGADQLGTGSWLLVYEAGAALSLGSSGVDVPVEFVVGTGSSSGTSAITMTALAQDRGNTPDSEASIETDAVSWNLDVTFSGGSGPLPPTILDWTYNGTPGSEDTAFVLGDVIDAAVSTSNPGVAYSYTVTLRDLPEDSIVTGMTQSSIGGETIFTATVTVAPGDDSQDALDALMAGITVTAPENENDNNSDFGFTATLAAAAVGGITADADTTADMPITPVSDDAEIIVTASETDEGAANTTATISAGTPIDGVYGQIVGGNLYVQISDTNNPGGTVSDSGGILSPTAVSGVAGVPDGTYYIVNVGTAGGSVDLTYTAPSGSVLEPGDVTFTAWAQTQETGASNIAAISGTGTADVIIVNNGVTAQSDPVTGNEAATTDNTGAIELSGLMVGVVDDDGSESIQSILLAGLPVGFQILVGNSAGDATVASQAANAGGNGTTNTWIVSTDGTMPAYVAVLPAINWSGSLTDLQLLVESAENTFSSTRVDAFALAPLTIEAVANGIEIDPTLSFGTEGSIIDVNLNASMSDAVISPVAGDDSVETTTLLIAGLGEYAAFYVDTTLVTTQSYDSASDTYTITGLSQDDLDDLGFVQAASALTDQDGGTSGTQIAVSVHTVESVNGDMSASDTGMLTVSLTAVLATSFDDNFILGEVAINGGDGNDNVDFRVGESVSNTELAALLDEIESIDLSADGPNGIFGGLSGLDVEDITGSDTGTLTIDGDADDTVVLSSAVEWTTDGIPSGDYLTYTNAMTGVTIMIDEVIAVSYDL